MCHYETRYHKNPFVSFNVCIGISPWYSFIKFNATIKVHAFSNNTKRLNRINKNFHNPKLHQQMFIKIPCRYWSGLIPIDNFLGHYIKGMKIIQLTDPVSSYFY